MPAYFSRDPGDILREALEKIQNNTPITSIAPGSVMRALAESMTTHVSDLYEVMNYNLNQNLLATATGSALDALGVLWNVERKTINNLAVLDKQIGSFYFYIESPILTNIVIPAGTAVYTDAASFVGRRFSYATTDAVTILAGRTKAYVGLKPSFTDAAFTAGPRTLVLHDFANPGTPVFCTNPKEIAQQIGYEADSEYRLRIIKSQRVQSGGTLTAVRFAGLGISGVREVKVRQAPYGMGSFECIIVPEQEGNATKIVSDATAAMEAVRPVGTRMFVKQPTTTGLDMSIQLVMPGAGIASLAETAARRATNGIRRYINSLLPGSPLVYNRLVAIILDSSDAVRDVIITSLAVNGAEIMRKNFQPAEDEQIISGNISVTVASA